MTSTDYFYAEIVGFFDFCDFGRFCNYVDKCFILFGVVCIDDFCTHLFIKINIWNMICEVVLYVFGKRRRMVGIFFK